MVSRSGASRQDLAEFHLVVSVTVKPWEVLRTSNAKCSAALRLSALMSLFKCFGRRGPDLLSAWPASFQPAFLCLAHHPRDCPPSLALLPRVVRHCLAQEWGTAHIADSFSSVNSVERQSNGAVGTPITILAHRVLPRESSN